VIGVDGGDALEDLSDRGVHRLPALDDDLRALVAQDVAVAAALRDCDERHLGRRRLRGGVELREPALALRGLAPHVPDLDAPGVDDPDRPPAVEGALGLVGVDVDLRDRRVARDEQRVAERLEARMQRVEVECLTLDHEHRAVSVLRLLVVDRLLGDLVRHLRHVGKRLAGECMEDAADELDQPGAAGVDDARLAELVEHLGGAANRVVAARHDPREALDDRQRAHVPELRLLGHLADDGQHRPLHGKLHRVVRARRPRTERLGHHVAVDLVALAEDTGHAADDRRENDAGIPLGLHRRGALHVRGQLGRRGRVRAVELGDDPLHGLLEVRPGVTVGDGIDVERVDPATMPFDVLESGRGEEPDGGKVDHSALRALSTWTSTALTSSPV